VVVDDEDLVEERDRLHQSPAGDLHDPADGGGLVAAGIQSEAVSPASSFRAARRRASKSWWEKTGPAACTGGVWHLKPPWGALTVGGGTWHA
jgi:hypothetical protein